MSREKLMEELFIKGSEWNAKNGGIHDERKFSDLDNDERDIIGFIADFIIEDRKRICQPLIDLLNKLDKNSANVILRLDEYKLMIKSVIETLKLAGLSGE